MAAKAPPAAVSQKPPDSLEASLDAQAEVLAASLGGEGSHVDESAPGSEAKPDLIRQRADQEEISKLVDQLPERIREQMEELFRARYTRIERLESGKPSVEVA